MFTWAALLSVHLRVVLSLTLHGTPADPSAARVAPPPPPATPVYPPSCALDPRRGPMMPWVRAENVSISAMQPVATSPFLGVFETEAGCRTACEANPNCTQYNWISCGSADRRNHCYGRCDNRWELQPVPCTVAGRRVAAAAPPPPPRGVMRLHLLQDPEALCLDGSPGGFYFAPATNPVQNYSWHIHIEGGGWCYTLEDCWLRSKEGLGSSKGWGPFSAGIGGIGSMNCSINPEFCGFNRVFLKYCDGGSQAGYRQEPWAGPDGKKVFIRGQRILSAALAALSEDFGMSNAREVLLTGCSAGGASTYMHADSVGEWLRVLSPTLVKYKAAPVSGFFLQHENVLGQPVYADQMRVAYQTHNASGGIDSGCRTSASAAGEEWRCMLANYSFPHITTPLFVLNSALDWWSIMCILTAAPIRPGYQPSPGLEAEGMNGNCTFAGNVPIPEWATCGADPEGCNAAQISSQINPWIRSFLADYSSSGGGGRIGSGAFIHSCNTHCEAERDPDWPAIVVGGVSMRDAVSAWWRSVDSRTAEHMHLPCMYKTSVPHKCNPSCMRGP